MKSINRWTPLNLGRGITLKNRVVVPAMASGTALPSGKATAATCAHYERLATSGAGLIIVEYSFVSMSGRSEENQLGAASDDQIEGLSEIARIIKRSGAVAGLQLVHGGGKTSKELTGGVLLAPSAVPVPAKNATFEAPTPMSSHDIANWKESFLAAAGRALKAGFDLVEIHASHGYGFNQWLSPITNLRTDDYGGSRENRTRLLREVISDIRKTYPELIVTARLPGQDFIEGGLSVSDMKSVSTDLLVAGLDLISVSSGLGGWRRPGGRETQGYLVEEARAIKAVLPCPVIGVGGIETGDYIDSVLSNGTISLAAVGRAILANPALWYKHNLGDFYDVSNTVS